MKKGKVAALAGILAAVGMGLFFPDFVAGVADQKMKDQVQFIMIDGVGCMGETEETGKAYVEEQGFTFPVYYDRKMEAVINYGIQAFPTTYILNSEGRLVTGGRGMLSKDNLQGLLDQVMK